MIRKPVFFLLMLALLVFPPFTQAQDCDPRDTVGWIYVSFIGCTPVPEQGPITLSGLPASGGGPPQAERKTVGDKTYWVYRLNPDRRVDNLQLKVSDLQGRRVKGPITGKPTRIDGTCVGHYQFTCELAWTAVVWSQPGKAKVRYKDDKDKRQQDQETRFRIEGLDRDATLELEVRSGDQPICQKSFTLDDLEKQQKVDLAQCLNELLLSKPQDEHSRPPNAISLSFQLDKLNLKFLFIKREP